MAATIYWGFTLDQALLQVPDMRKLGPKKAEEKVLFIFPPNPYKDNVCVCM